MRKILNILLVLISFIGFSGCKCKETEHDFSYFKKHIGVIENYKYYVVKENIHNEELLLYQKEKHVYVDGEKYRILVDTKEIAPIDSDNLYDEKQEEFYKKGTTFYYKEGNEWRTENREVSSSLGLTISKDIFKSYKISEEKGNKILKGNLKNDSLNNFFGFDLNNSKDVTFSIVISSKDKIKSISIEYMSNEGNNVSVSIEFSYSQIIKFELPTVS